LRRLAREANEPQRVAKAVRDRLRDERVQTVRERRARLRVVQLRGRVDEDGIGGDAAQHGRVIAERRRKRQAEIGPRRPARRMPGIGDRDDAAPPLLRQKPREPGAELTIPRENQPPRLVPDAHAAPIIPSSVRLAAPQNEKAARRGLRGVP